LTPKLSPLFTWRTAITESDLRPTSRHVALTLSLYMGEKGDHAWPAVTTLAEDTGLDRRTVQRALRELQDSGWLAVRIGGGHATSRYVGLIPEGRHRTAPAESAASEAADDRPGGGVAPPESVITTPTPRQVLSVDWFEKFWKLYPRKVEKQGARRRFEAIIQRGVDPELLIAGARRYRDDPNREQAFTKHPTTWLNNGCWDDEPLPPRLGRRDRAAEIMGDAVDLRRRGR
jgi:DNA-binding MarR family transcriptional regulator